MRTTAPTKPATDRKLSFYRLQSYLSPDEKQTVDRALNLLGRGTSISRFAAAALLKEARAIIAEHERKNTRRGKPPVSSQGKGLKRRDLEDDPVLRLWGAGIGMFDEFGGGEAFL